MIVVMKQGSSAKHVEHVVQLVREMGLKEHIIVGQERTVIAVIGDDRFKDRSVLESADGVDRVVPILAPYKMASKEIKNERTEVKLGNTQTTIGGLRVGVIAGPCSVESKSQLLQIAHAVKASGAKGLRGGAFKPAHQSIFLPGSRRGGAGAAGAVPRRPAWPSLPKSCPLTRSSSSTATRMFCRSVREHAELQPP